MCSVLHAVNHLVANAGIWSTCPFDEITNITAFTTIMVNPSSQQTKHVHACM
jgi:hypothetical protein